jgi:adenosine deaminase
MDLHIFAQRMPKAELHVHLEGAIRPSTLLTLAERNGISLPAKDLEELRAFYRFRDFPHFVDVYVTITSCLQAPEDYALIAYEFGADCDRQNIRYAEATFTIATNMRLTGLPWEAILEGLNDGRQRAQRDFGIDWRWIFDISRDNPETQDQVVDISLEARNEGVIALGLGGNEAEYPPELFAGSFARAQAAGLPCVPHAGETVGPPSVWAALEQLHADRIGHGVRSIEDPTLVSYLREKQVPLEICPTSNIRLGVYRDFNAHPLPELWDADLFITVNSDDPPLFGTDLNREYQVLVDHFAFDADDLERVSLNAVRASFLTASGKARLEQAFQSEFDGLRRELC